MENFMETLMGKNWRTSLTGLLGSIAVVLIPVLQGQEITTANIVNAIIVGALGYFAKDKTTTGIGVGATTEADLSDLKKKSKQNKPTL